MCHLRPSAVEEQCHVQASSYFVGLGSGNEYATEHGRCTVTPQRRLMLANQIEMCAMWVSESTAGGKLSRLVKLSACSRRMAMVESCWVAIPLSNRIEDVADVMRICRTSTAMCLYRALAFAQGRSPGSTTCES